MIKKGIKSGVDKSNVLRKLQTSNLKLQTILFLLSIIAVTASAQKQRPPYNVFKGDTINRTDAKGMKQGIWKKYYSNDSLFSTGQFKDDKAYGVFQTYYKTGEKEMTLTYRKGTNIGDAIIVYENGKTKAKGKYVNQKKDSVWNYYDESGALSSTEKYVNGVADGVWKTYYPGGSVSREETYVKGKRSGPYKEYFNDGKTKVIANMVDDNYDGVVTLYFPDGKVWMQGKYIKHVREGVWNVWDQDGKKIREDKYKNGVLTNPPKEELPKEKIPEPNKGKDDGF